MNGTHEAHAMFAAYHAVKATHRAFGVCNLIQWRLRRRLLTRTKYIRVRRLGILDSRWMIAMRSLMATTTRQLATVMSANSRFDMSGPGKCSGLRGWIVASQVVVVVCAREGVGLAESPSLGTADEDLVKDG
jgi:hypothetical protein